MKRLYKRGCYFAGALGFFALSSGLCGCFSDLLDKQCTHDGHCFANERCIEQVCTKVDDVAETVQTSSICVRAVNDTTNDPILDFLVCTPIGQFQSPSKELCFDVEEGTMSSSFKVGASKAGFDFDEESLNGIPTGPIVLRLRPCPSGCKTCGQ